MILLRGKWVFVCALMVSVDGSLGRFDLVDCLHDYRHEVTIHGDDVLAHTNWELSENWLHRYKYVHSRAAMPSLIPIAADSSSIKLHSPLPTDGDAKGARANCAWLTSRIRSRTPPERSRGVTCCKIGCADVCYWVLAYILSSVWPRNCRTASTLMFQSQSMRSAQDYIPSCVD